MSGLTKGIVAGTVATIVAAAILAGFVKGVQVWNHVDVRDVKVSNIKDDFDTTNENVRESYDRVEQRLLEIQRASERQQEAISSAVSELEKVKRDIALRSVSGKVTREIRAPLNNQNIIWVNKFSDARAFKDAERLRLITDDMEIIVQVGGYIRDTRESVVGKVNMNLAAQIGVSERDGILENVILQRLSEES